MNIEDCPFCEGDIGGCCFCDHSGKINTGEGYFFKTAEQVSEAKENINDESFLRNWHNQNGITNKPVLK